MRRRPRNFGKLLKKSNTQNKRINWEETNEETRKESMEKTDK